MYCCLPKEALAAFSVECLRAAGMSADDAELAAAALVRADLRGIGTHGVRWLPNYVRALQVGRMNPRPQIAVARDFGAALVVEGDGGLGHVVSTRAMQLCIERAREEGAAFAAVKGSRHNGAASVYALMAADAGMIGLSLTGGGVRVAPAGGREALLGTNPVAFAAPTATEPPLVMDIATSVVAGAKVEERAAAGLPLPVGWALDRAGRPTTDAAVAHDGVLLPLGSVLELGSYKGYALSLMVETLCNVLTGTATGPERARGVGPEGPALGHFFAALRVDLTQPLAAFRERLDRTLRLLRESAPAEGCDRVYTPGEKEWECEQDRLAHGIPLAERDWTSLQALAGELHLSLPKPDA